MVETKNTRHLELLKLYETKCACLPKFQSDPRKNDITKIVNFIEKLYEKSNIPESNSKLQDLILKCKETIETGGDKILSHLFELANFLKINKSQIEQKLDINDAPNSESNLKRQIDQRSYISAESLSSDKPLDKPLDEPNIKVSQNTPKKLTLKDLTKVENISNIEVKDRPKSCNTLETSNFKPKAQSETEVFSSDTNEDLEIKNISEEDQKRLKIIQKLDDFCIKLNQKIIQYENQEIAFDDLENIKSNYLIESKLKERFVKAYNKLLKYCKKYPHLVANDIKKTKNKGGQFCKKIKVKSTGYEEINAYISECLNKRKQFPDYCEVLEWISEANKKNHLGLDDRKIEDISKKSFTDICKILKKRRISDEKQIQLSRISSIKLDSKIDETLDPAENDKELELILANNKKLGEKKYDEIINSFVAKQENNEDFDLENNSINEEKDDNDNQDNVDDNDEDQENDNSEILDLSLKTVSSLNSENKDEKHEEDDDDNDEEDNDYNDEDDDVTRDSLIILNKNEDNLQIKNESAKRSLSIDEKDINNSKKFKPETTDESDDSNRLRRKKPIIAECSSAAQSSDEFIVLD